MAIGKLMQLFRGEDTDFAKSNYCFAEDLRHKCLKSVRLLNLLFSVQPSFSVFRILKHSVRQPSAPQFNSFFCIFLLVFFVFLLLFISDKLIVSW